MHVFASFQWPDESSIDVHVDDDLGDYNPIRTGELCDFTLDLLTKAVTERDRADAAVEDKPTEP